MSARLPCTLAVALRTFGIRRGAYPWKMPAARVSPAGWRLDLVDNYPHRSGRTGRLSRVPARPGPSFPDHHRLPRMLAITFRSASLADVPAMAGLREASGWAGGAGAETMGRYLTGAHHPQQALEPRAVFVADNAGAVVGFVAGHLTTRLGCAGELQWLLVAPAHRGGWVAANLLAALATWFMHQGATRVCVNVAPENVRARRFYARRGAVELSEHWMVWSDVTVAADAAGPTRATRPAEESSS